MGFLKYHTSLKIQHIGPLNHVLFPEKQNTQPNIAVQECSLAS